MSTNKTPIWRLVLAVLGLSGLSIGPYAHAQAFDEDHNAPINGTVLHFRVRGTDKSHPYLVILHGGPGFSSHMFYPWGTSVEKDVNVVYLDQRGHGESKRYKIALLGRPTLAEIKGLDIADSIADMEGVREFLKIDKWFVLGHSWGGLLGINYVAAHPDHVLGYIHMDGLVSVPRMEEDVYANAENQLKPAIEGTDAAKKADAASKLAMIRSLRVTPPGQAQRLIGTFEIARETGLYVPATNVPLFTIYGQKIDIALKGYKIPPTATTAAEPLMGFIVNDHFLTRDDQPLLSKIKVPTLIINGKQDGVISPKTAEAVHLAIPDSQLIELDACGHFPFAEQPEKTTSAILDFVKAQQRRSP